MALGCVRLPGAPACCYVQHPALLAWSSAAQDCAHWPVAPARCRVLGPVLLLRTQAAQRGQKAWSCCWLLGWR